MLKPIAVTMLLAAGFTVAALDGVEAAGKSKKYGTSYARACSRYGNGCVSGPVRPGLFGPQVRLKSGTWIDCKGDCGLALLEETIDFWDSQADKAKIATP